MPEKAAGQITIRLGQVHAVEQVENVCSEFYGKAFPFHHLREFCIDVSETRASEGISTHIALLSEGGDRERGGRRKACKKIAPLARVYGASGRRVWQIVTITVGVEVTAPRLQTNDVSARIRDRDEWRRGKQGERQSALQHHNVGHTPAAQNALGKAIVEWGRNLHNAINREAPGYTVIRPTVLGPHVQRIEDRFAVIRPIVRAAHVIRGFTESVNTSQLPRVGKPFAQHKGSVIAVRSSYGSAIDDRAEIRIQARLVPVIQNQVSRKAIHVSLDIQVPAPGAVVVRLSEQTMSQVPLDR